MSEPSQDQPTASKAGHKAWLRNGAIAVVVLGAGVYGFRSWQFNDTHVSTDDAYVTNDIVSVAPEEPGRVATVAVELNQPVKAGDVLFTLDSTSFEADYKQAQAALAVAQASASSGQASVELASQTSEAQRTQASGGVAQARSDVEAARLAALQATEGANSARLSEPVATGQYEAAREAIQVRQAEVTRAQRAIDTARAQIVVAEAQLETARANLTGLRSAAEYASKEAERNAHLAAQGAVSQSMAEQRRSESDRAQAALDQGKQAVAQAQAQVTVSQNALATAQVGLQQANLAVKQAQTEADVQRRSIATTESRTREAQAAALAAQESISAARARVTQATGKLREQSVVAQRTAVSESARKTAEAKVAEAEAALLRAKIALDRTTIKAPADGFISKKSVVPGQQVTTGQPMLALIPQKAAWIIANFKETQLGRLHAGQEAEVEIDATGQKFRGHIDSITGGTGSVFALLPADNATGNFTKIVQRVPVKIVLEPGQPHLEELRAGLSTTVTVRVK
jgi:membrane fusion protein (multidrug efflux system)